MDSVDDWLPLASTTMTSDDVTTPTANDDAPSALKQFSLWYSGIHGYLCIAICVFGIISNILNIVVLTDRRMATSPTNFLLTALAISDLLPMLTYLPYAVYFHCVAGVHPDPRNGYPQAWIVFLLFNNSFIINQLRFDKLRLPLRLKTSCCDIFIRYDSNLRKKYSCKQQFHHQIATL